MCGGTRVYWSAAATTFGILFNDFSSDIFVSIILYSPRARELLYGLFLSDRRSFLLYYWATVKNKPYTTVVDFGLVLTTQVFRIFRIVKTLYDIQLSEAYI